MKWPGILQLFRNSDFSNPRFFETPDFSNHGTLPLDLLQSNTVILPSIFGILDFSKLSIFRTNSCLPWKKFIRNLPWISRTRRKVLLSSFHLNGHTSEFYKQSQKVVPPSITQWTVPRKVLLMLRAFRLSGHLLGLAFLWCCLLCVQGGSNFWVLSKILTYDHSNDN